MSLQIQRPEKYISGDIALVTSKSISNRLLILRSLFPDKIYIKGLSEADDAVLLGQLLKQVAAGHGGTIDAGNAGTAYRFLAALLAQTKGEWILTGSDRMKERPVMPLVDALRQIGGDIKYLGKEGYPPLQIKGKKIKGGRCSIEGELSSQYISALLLITPALEESLQIFLKGEISSRPYLEMTLNILKEIGMDITFSGNEILARPSTISHTEFTVEPDWSSASYFYSLLAIADKGEIYIKGLSRDPKQGDAVLAPLMEAFGIETIFDEEGTTIKKSRPVIELFIYDFKDQPDLVPAIAVACAATGVKGEFSGVENLGIKESDRMVVLQQELKKVGCDLNEVNGVWHLIPSSSFPENIYFKTYGDHRMAMAFACFSMVIDKVEIEDHRVVSKSFPGFWEELGKLGFRLSIL